MKKFKKNQYKFWHSPFALIVLFSLIVIFGYNMIGLVEKKRDTSNKKEQILSQIEDLKEREQLLQKNNLKLETEEGKEEVIREKYQVSKEGEKVIILVDEEDNSLIDESNERSSLWDWIKKRFNR